MSADIATRVLGVRTKRKVDHQGGLAECEIKEEKGTVMVDFMCLLAGPLDSAIWSDNILAVSVKVFLR